MPSDGKKWRSLFAVHKKCLTFVIANANGALDEWLSQRSAKPCTAVRIRQAPQESLIDEALFLYLQYSFIMADNYLEKRMEQHRAAAGIDPKKAKANNLVSLLEKNRSTRGYDSSFVVREDQLRRIVAVNCKVASARNRQLLRFRTVTAGEADKVLPHIKMGSGLKELSLPLPGTEPNAFVVVCSTVEPRPSTYIDLGISVQSMLLQATEIGLNGLCIMSFDKEAIVSALSLPLEPLMVIAVGRSAEKHALVEIGAGDDHAYYRENGVHCVPKVRLEELLIND